MRKWLIDLRTTKGLRPTKVAEMACISYAYYNFIERGRRRPSPDVAKRIAAVLGFADEWYRLLDDKKTTDFSVA